MPLLSRRKISCFPGIFPLGGGIGGPNCDFSTYWNGTSEVNVDFVNKAPLNINTSGVTNDAIIADISFDPAVDEEFVFTTRLVEDVGVTDKMVILYDSGSSSFLQMILFTGPSSFYRVQGFNGTTNSFSDSNDDMVFGDKYELGFKLSGAAATKLVTCTVDGVDQTSTDTLDFTGVTFDKIIIGSGVGFTDILKLLAFNMSSTQLGNVNFVSNTDDGLNFFSSIGDQYTASDQSPLTIQYPDYIPSNAVDVISVPATGPLSLESTSPVDTIKATYSFDPDQDWFFDIEAFVTDASSNDKVFTIYDSGNASNLIEVLYRPDGLGRLRVVAQSVNTATIVSDFNDIFALDEWIAVGMRYDKATQKIYAMADGVDTTDDETIDFTGVTFDTIVIGSDKLETNNPAMLVRSSNSDLLGYTNFISRLRTENDVDGSKFFSNATIPVEYVVTDSSPTDIFFPNIGEYNDAYLISDTPCEGNNLLTKNSVAITKNGEFIFKN